MTTRRSGPVVAAIVAILVLTAAFAWVAYRNNALERQNAARVAAQAKAAQELQQPSQAAARWQVQSRAPVALQVPAALACGGDRVYVVGNESPGRDTLLICDRKVSPLTRIALPGVPRGVSVAKDAILVALDARVMRYDLQGKPLTGWGVGGDRARVSSLAAVGQEVWVADAGQRAVWRYEPGGRLLGKLGSPDPATGYPGLLVPSPHLDLALTSQGNVLVNNPGKLRIETWSPQGKLLGQFGRPSIEPDGFAGCCNPIALAVLPDGRVVTAEKGLVRVKVYRPDGTFEGLVATTPTLTAGVDSLDLATTAAGEILVLDPRARTILTFTETKSHPQGNH